MKDIYYTQEVDSAEIVARAERKRTVAVYNKISDNHFEKSFETIAPFTFTAKEMIDNHLADKGVFDNEYKLVELPHWMV